MEHIITDSNFVDAQDLIELISNWITDPVIKRNVRVEDGLGYVFSHAVLVGKVLSDKSIVYDIRLS